MTRSAQVQIQRATRATRLPSDLQFRRWAKAAHAGTLDVTVRIVGTREGQELNRRFRGRDYATNVLTFVYEGTASALCGDIVLCAPVVRREALAQGKSLDAHYAHLLVHSILHLSGHDHEDDADAARMERAERLILARLGYADPYALEALRAA